MTGALQINQSFFGDDYRGGIAALTATTNDGTATSVAFNFCIGGDNPTQAAVREESGADRFPFPQEGWFFFNMIRYESFDGSWPNSNGWKQFKPNGMPIWGDPCGVGLGQLDPPPSINSGWNWRTNINESVTRLVSEKQPLAQARWEAAQTKWAIYNQNNPTSQAPTPADRNFGPGCPTFSMNPVYAEPGSSANRTNYFDANWMKSYNGNYKGWFLDFEVNQWVLSQITMYGSNTYNYVARACGCETPYSTPAQKAQCIVP